MNIFHVLGYDISRAYPRASKTSVGSFGLVKVASGPSVPNPIVSEFVVAGALSKQCLLIGEVLGNSIVVGDLAPNNRVLNGEPVSFAISVDPASILIRSELIGSVSALVNLSDGALLQQTTLESAIQAAANVWGTASLSMALNGQPLTFTAQTASQLQKVENLSGASSAQGSVALAGVTVGKPFAASVQEITLVTGSIAQRTPLAGTASGTSVFGPTFLLVAPGYAIKVSWSANPVLITAVLTENLVLQASAESIYMTATADYLYMDEAA